MATPVIEYIAANIKSVLDTIDDMTVVRSTRIDFSDVVPSESDVLLVVDSLEMVEGASNMDTWTATIDLYSYVGDVSGGAVIIDERIAIKASDIIQKLAVDVSRGGYAKNTTVTDVEYVHNEQGCGSVITVNILFRTVMGNPYTAA
ncbi:MAG: hypothetical protein GY869_03220 [Planctomycetes bacterium]|nr:hypothetical protein [Planctomycetota bacterium]